MSACRRLRASNNQVPIIMLTAKGDEGSRIQVWKSAPTITWQAFNPRELLARIKAVLRRQAPVVPGAPAARTRASPSVITTFPGYPRIEKGDEVHMLTTGEFAVLKALVQHAREPLTRDKLMNLARGREWDAWTLHRRADFQSAPPDRAGSVQAALKTDRLGVGYVFVPDGNK